ncbi:GAF domain-containing protein [Mycobacterium sp.]|uniref:GAF domain-containing protein n=1 Tax=Mycobacterium sp. TaxID=1785 RepID=UPI0033420BDB|nr:domain S-box protein [Mycobacterium sp.]
MADGSRSFDDELVGLFELSHDAFCIAGFDGYLRRANPAFARSLGYTLEELLARPFMDNVYPDDLESVEAVLVELAAGSDVVGFECREVCADGSVRWFEWSTSSRPEAGIVYGVARDVTDRRMANAELSALRRIATLAAEGVAPLDLFAVLAEEVARVVNVPYLIVSRYELDGTATECASFPPGNSLFPIGKRWSLDGTNALALVRTTSGAARLDDLSQLDGELAEAARRSGIRSTVGVPIIVAGRLWGAMAVATRDPNPLPGDTEARLANFTGLLATAIGNAESREALGRLADEQAALRRVATLVARGAAPAEVFSAVAAELARVLVVQHASVWRYEPDGAATLLAASDEPGAKKMPVGDRFTLEGDNLAARVLRTGRPARMDSLDEAAGSAAARIRELGIRAAVGAPIIVDGHLWGVAAVASLRPEPLPADTETHLADFADLVATAIGNAATRAELQARRDELSVLAEQQAALRRVATLVARGVSPSEVFEAVADEMARCVHVSHATVSHYDADAFIPDAICHENRLRKLPEGLRLPLAGDNVAARVFRTRRTARMDSHDNAPGDHAARIRGLGIRSAVGVPIIVDGSVWGAAIVGSSAPEPLPLDTEERIGDFADLVATAIANAATRAELQASRDELSVLAEQQAALRRVATLVARGTPPSEVYSAVADEMARCLHAGNASVSTFDDDMVTMVAVAAVAPAIKRAPLVGERYPVLDGDNIATRVFHTGWPARLEGVEFQNAPGVIAEMLRKTGLRSTVGVPIIVDERVWGMVALGWLRREPLSSDTEARMSDFADLVGTAIANAATRAELIASRARIVAAADEGRRRLERDLHDGAQQRLVALGLQVRLAEASVPPGLQALEEQLGDIVSGLAGVTADLQEISRGIHPAILSKGGLGSALKTLARRSAIPVTLDLTIDQRLQDSVEVGAYYVVSEALTNAAKHSRATQVVVSGHTKDRTLWLSIRDDGIGGADMGNGSGLVGLADRVEALGGRMRIKSPAGRGTSLEARIPLDST